MLSWALFALVSFFLITSTVGSMVSGVSGAVSGLFGGGGSKDVTVMVDKAQEKGLKATDLSLDNIKKEVFKLIDSAEGSDIISDGTSKKAKDAVDGAGSDTRQAIKNLDVEDLEQFFNKPNFDIDNKGDLKISAEGNGGFLMKEELKGYLSKNTQMGDGEIDNKVDKWEEKIETAVGRAEKYYAEARQKVIEYSDKAADAVATISITAFILFLLGSLAAIFGGITGSPLLTVEEEHLDDRPTTVQD